EVDGSLRNLREQGPACFLPFRESEFRVPGQLVALPSKHHADAEESALEVRRDLEGVAPVVAGPGDHQDRSRRVAAQAARGLRCGLAGALHEARPGRTRLDLADRARAVDRQHGHRQHCPMTCSAMASEAVMPGDSIPNRLTSPATPCSAGPWMRK